MTAEERAVAVFTGCDIKHDSCPETCVDCVANAIREARNAALEEAASLMDDCGTDNYNQSSTRSYRFAAERIRALAEKDH